MDVSTLQTILITWAGPTGIAIVIGFIIWLIQHNIALMTLTRTVGKHDTAIDKMIEEHNDVVLMLRTMQQAQQGILEKAEAAEKHIEEHNAEAESWKRRIVATEIKLEHFENKGT